MNLIIGGSIAIVLSIMGLGYFFDAFLKVLAGVIPISLLLGGCLALYLYREMKTDDFDDLSEDNSDDLKTPEPETSAPEPAAEPEETPVEEPAAEKESSKETAASSAPKFIGNVDSLVFHTPECNYVTSKKCTAFFDTAEQAIKEGYKACGVCKPQ